MSMSGRPEILLAIGTVRLARGLASIIQNAPAAQDELDVEQAVDVELARYGRYEVQHFILLFLSEREAREYRYRVAGVDSGGVYMFEYAGDEHVAAVAERVAFKLAAREELVDHDFLARHRVEGLFEHRDERLFVVDGAHRDASDDEARAHHERVAESVRGFERLFYRGDVYALRLGHAYTREQARELAAVLRRLYDLRAGAEELHAARCEVEAEAQRGLPAEAGEYARRLFAFEYRHRVVDGQRLEVERVGYVVVGADRLGVDVHHYRADAAAAQRLYGLDAAVVEFDACAIRIGPEPRTTTPPSCEPCGSSPAPVRAVVVARAGGETRPAQPSTSR